MEFMSKEIQLTQGKVAIVDDEDFERINQWKWYYGGGYAGRNKKRTKGIPRGLSLHCFIMGKPSDGLEVDHIDGNKLNNQKSNLRIATRSQNAMNVGITKRNKSGYKGVSWHKCSNKWEVRIRINGKKLHLGLFINKEDAAKAYNDAAKLHHGEFANLNKINE